MKTRPRRGDWSIVSARQPGVAPQVLSRRLYEDGLRLEAIDSARAVARFKEAARSGPVTEGGARASLRLIRRDIAGASAVEALAPAGRHSPGCCCRNATVTSPEVADLLGSHHARPRRGRFRWSELPSGRSPTLPRGRAGERHVGGAPGRGIVVPPDRGRMARRPPTLRRRSWPLSDRLHLGGLRPGILAERYADSPYLAVVRGESTDGYRAARGLFARVRRDDSRCSAARRRAAGRPCEPDEPDAPRRRPRQPRQPIPSRAGASSSEDGSRTLPDGLRSAIPESPSLAAGTAGFGRELDGVIDLDRLGGLVTKAVSRQPRPGNPPPRVAEFRGGMLNSVGLANPGLDAGSRTTRFPGWQLAAQPGAGDRQRRGLYR